MTVAMAEGIMGMLCYADGDGRNFAHLRSTHQRMAKE